MPLVLSISEIMDAEETLVSNFKEETSTVDRNSKTDGQIDGWMENMIRT